MTDPKRWRDDEAAPPEIRALFDAGRGKASTLDAEDREHGAVVAAKLAAGATVGLSAAGSTVLSAKLVTKLIIGVVAVSAIAAVATTEPWASSDPQPSASAESSSGSSRHGGRAAGTPALTDDEALEATPDPTADPASLTAPPALAPLEVARPETGESARRAARQVEARFDEASRAVSSPPEPAALPLPADDPSLAEEAALLESARRELERNPSAALAHAETHARDHARGQLAAERELIAVDALLRLGRSADARARANAWLAAHPDGLYSTRMRRLAFGE